MPTSPSTSERVQAGLADEPDRVWAVEGANGARRPLAQHLLEAGEHVADVPAKFAARVRLFDTGHNRKTDALDAYSVAVVAVRTANLRVLKVDGELEALRMLTDRREALTRRRVQTVCRLQALLAELLPGQAKKDLTSGQARPRPCWPASVALRRWTLPRASRTGTGSHEPEPAGEPHDPHCRGHAAASGYRRAGLLPTQEIGWQEAG
ncbi:transposase [Nocardioides carbamazepini]|uniref:IS110 family transposase n=1 Tax=Nocardioides carbamazepini TaxID=2854259 RepID=UPI002352480B|nr:transposase [Nocardioides carbamazepini]